MASCSFLTSFLPADLLDLPSSNFSGTSLVFDDDDEDFLLIFGRIGCCLHDDDGDDTDGLSPTLSGFNLSFSFSSGSRQS